MSNPRRARARQVVGGRELEDSSADDWNGKMGNFFDRFGQGERTGVGGRSGSQQPPALPSISAGGINSQRPLLQQHQQQQLQYSPLDQAPPGWGLPVEWAPPPEFPAQRQPALPPVNSPRPAVNNIRHRVERQHEYQGPSPLSKGALLDRLHDRLPPALDGEMPELEAITEWSQVPFETTHSLGMGTEEGFRHYPGVRQPAERRPIVFDPNMFGDNSPGAPRRLPGVPHRHSDVAQPEGRYHGVDPSFHIPGKPVSPEAEEVLDSTLMNVGPAERNAIEELFETDDFAERFNAAAEAKSREIEAERRRQELGVGATGQARAQPHGAGDHLEGEMAHRVCHVCRKPLVRDTDVAAYLSAPFDPKGAAPAYKRNPPLPQRAQRRLPPAAARPPKLPSKRLAPVTSRR